MKKRLPYMIISIAILAQLQAVQVITSHSSPLKP